MDRIVTYRAADEATGMTPQELREALRRALTIENYQFRGFIKRRIISIDVIETEPGVRIEGND